MCSPSVNQSQNIPPYPPTNVHQRSFPPNVVTIPNHSQNVSTQSSKSQRTSPISASVMANGSTDYSTKQSSATSQTVPHQYHGQNQSNVVSNNNQRKHHHQQQHHHLVGKGDVFKPFDYFFPFVFRVVRGTCRGIIIALFDSFNFNKYFLLQF